MFISRGGWRWWPVGVLLSLSVWTGGAVAQGKIVENTNDVCQPSYSEDGTLLTLPCVRVNADGDEFFYSLTLKKLTGSFALLKTDEQQFLTDSDCISTYSIETDVLEMNCVNNSSIFYKLEGQSSFKEISVQKATARRMQRNSSCLANGFDLPVKDPNPNDGKSWGVPYNGFSNFLPSMGGIHGAEDWNYGNGIDDLGLPVYASSRGVVKKISDLGKLGYLLALEHTGSFFIEAQTTSKVFSAYVHIKDIPSKIQLGYCAEKGEILGYVMDPGGGPHLHFEIARGDKSLGDWYPNDLGNGYYKSLDKVSEDGFVNPREFIAKNNKTLLLDDYYFTKDADISKIFSSALVIGAEITLTVTVHPLNGYHGKVYASLHRVGDDTSNVGFDVSFDINDSVKREEEGRIRASFTGTIPRELGAGDYWLYIKGSDFKALPGSNSSVQNPVVVKVIPSSGSTEKTFRQKAEALFNAVEGHKQLSEFFNEGVRSRNTICQTLSSDKEVCIRTYRGNSMGTMALDKHFYFFFLTGSKIKLTPETGIPLDNANKALCNSLCW